MNDSQQQILIVDDDAALCELLATYLGNEGFSVASVHDGHAALALLNQPNNIDAVVLDIMMPGISGLEVLQQLRPQIDTPVLMLTGRGDDIDRIVGLEMGADDYLGKPCNPRELSARLKAILRRSSVASKATANTATLQLHGIELDPGNLTVLVAGNSLNFTSAEFKVLELLMKSAGQTLSKASLTEAVLHRKLTAHDRSIDVHISRIRQKLSPYTKDSGGAKTNSNDAAIGLNTIIRSVRGVGYQMLAESDSDV